MGQIDKAKFQAALDKVNAELEADGKTLQDRADETKTAALEKMKKTHTDPAYAKMFNEK